MLIDRKIKKNLFYKSLLAYFKILKKKICQIHRKTARAQS